MAKLIATYQQPSDTVAFDAYYFQKHAPLAKTLPGLRSYEISRGDVMGVTGKHGVYLVAILGFDSLDAIMQALSSEQGKATAADLANFAGAGVDLMMADYELI